MKLFILPLLLITLALSSCTYIDPRDPNLVQDNTQKIHNISTGMISFVGPDIRPETYWTLRLHADQKNNKSFQYTLQATVDYQTYRSGFYDRYEDYYPTEHSSHTLYWKQSSCRGNRFIYHDSKTIDLTKEDLEEKIATGISFTFQCVDGSIEMNVPGEYISGFLGAMKNN